MIQLPNRHPQACNDELLLLLSQDKLDSVSEPMLVEHLNHCSTCRSKLTQLSFDESEWSETREIILAEEVRRSSTTVSSGTNPTKETNKIASLVRWLEPIVGDRYPNESYIGRVDSYLVKRVIGFGGMGVVLEVWDTTLHRAVALKAMHPHLAAHGTARQRFVREARGAAAVVHPNVVAIYTVHAEHDPPYFVMPLVTGESLQSRIDRIGPLDIDASLRIAIQIADGLAAAHAQGLIHRDIKPANILLELGTERALLTDFGVVRVLNETAMTAGSVIAGTPEYMSPEQASGRNTDLRSDLFSLGCVFYTMLTGRSPFRAETTWGVLKRVEFEQPRRLSEIRPDVPAAVECLVRWLLEKQPDQRVGSARDLADDLRQLLAHQVDRHQNGLPARLERRLSAESRHSGKAPHWIIVALSAALLLLCVLGLQKWSQYSKPHESDSSKTSVSASQAVSGLWAGNLATEALDREIQSLERKTRELQLELESTSSMPR